MATRMSEALPRDLRYEPTPKRVRGELGGETIVDTVRALLVWRAGEAVPRYAFPEEDIRMERFRSAGPGDDGAETYTLDGSSRDAWRFADPDLDGHVGVRWDALDRWLEEEDEAYAHPHDPYHRIDIHTTCRHVKVEIAGTVLAESRRPLMLLETGLPVRWYLPEEDVRMDLLEPSETTSVCAYKGVAERYWSARVDGELHEDVAWSYPNPLREGEPIRGLIAFFDERVDVTRDGELVDCGVTPWSRA